MMPHSIGQAIGLLLLLSMIAAIGLIAVGAVLCFVPGKRPRGQSLMTCGAAIFITAIYAGAINVSFISGRVERAILLVIGGALFFPLIVVAVRKWNMRRDNDEPLP